MTTNDQVAVGLRDVESELGGPPPAPLLNAVREAAPQIRARRRARARSRIGVGASLLVVVVAGAFTSPGRAATDWVADLAGIGDEPTLDHPFDKPGAVVIDAGRLSDGTPYEIVARIIDPADRFTSSERARHTVAVDPSEAPPPGELAARPDGGHICFGIDLPTQPKADQDSFCAGAHAERGGDEPFSTYGAFPYGALSASDPTILFGIIEDPAIAEVRVVEGRTATDPVVPSKILGVDPALLETVGREDPIWFFVSPVDESLVAAANRGDVDLYAVALDDAGAELSRVPMLVRKPARGDSSEYRRLLEGLREKARALSGDRVPIDSDEVQRAGRSPAGR